VVCPAAKFTVPDGSVPATKSDALAFDPPLPLTAQAADAVPVLIPERVTVKVNGVVPLLPSLSVAFTAAIDNVEAADVAAVARKV
jgi:hypothetical protein